MENDVELKSVFVYAPDMMFAGPYLKRELAGCDITITDIMPEEIIADYAFMLASASVYDQNCSDAAVEDAGLDRSSVYFRRESEFESAVMKHQTPYVIFRIPNPVGTGMSGLPREIVNRIHRDTYWLLGGNECRISTIHCVDVASAVGIAITCGLTGVFNITDGSDPLLADFAEALSFRLGNKRIPIISEKWARWIVGRRCIDRLKKSRTLSSRKFADATRGLFKPHIVTEYLHTHVYDSESL